MFSLAVRFQAALDPRVPLVAQDLLDHGVNLATSDLLDLLEIVDLLVSWILFRLSTCMFKINQVPGT